jgi:hypothetical protein
MENWIDNPNVTAVIFAYYPGQETGNAIASILYGEVNPSGKVSYKREVHVSGLSEVFSSLSHLESRSLTTHRMAFTWRTCRILMLYLKKAT